MSRKARAGWLELHNKPQTEDALHKSAGRFSVQDYILKNTNKCSIIIPPPHKTEVSQIVDNCQILVYYLNKCGVF